jgi:hypothetical protein
LGNEYNEKSTRVFFVSVSLPPEAVHFLWFLGRFSDLFHLELRLPIEFVNSGLRSVPGSLKLTAAGTVQDLHLFPSRDFHNEKRSPKNHGKNTKNFN